MTVIIFAALFLVMAAYNIWLAIKSRDTQKALDNLRAELDSREIELSLREDAVAKALDEVMGRNKALDFSEAESREIRAHYIVTESDTLRYSNEKLLLNGVRKRLSTALAESLLREFGSPTETKTAEGRTCYIYDFRCKRI